MPTKIIIGEPHKSESALKHPSGVILTPKKRRTKEEEDEERRKKVQSEGQSSSASSGGDDDGDDAKKQSAGDSRPKIIVGEAHQSGTQHPSGVTLEARKLTKEEDEERRKKIQREGQSISVGSGRAVKQSGGSVMPTAGRRHHRR